MLRLLHCFCNCQNNVILMGSPGSGKTTVGKLLGSYLGKSVIDVDNDHLESFWGMTVADKVSIFLLSCVLVLVSLFLG